MAGAAGPNTSETGLVFAYDTGNTSTCFYGEPTTNVAFSANPNLNSNSNWWINSGNATFNDNDTSITKPSILNVDTGAIKVFSAQTTATGNQQLGSSIVGINPSTTYSFSIWYYFTGTTMQIPPYVRTAVNNNDLAYFAYNGSTNYLTWPRNQWILLKATVLTQSNETGIYMSSYIGDTLGEKVYYFGYQVEQKSHCTPLVLGTRSGTQGMVPFISPASIDIDTVSFDSSANVIYDGTNDYIDLNRTATQLGIYDASYTAECFCYPTVLSSDRTMFGTDQTAFRQGLHLTFRGNVIYMGHYSSDFSAGTVSINNWYHIVFRYNAATSMASIFKNGVLQGSGAIASFIGTTTLFTGREFGAGNFAGYIPIAKIYNRPLTDLEVAQNFQAIQYRFGI
jgi:hypothetical protein